MEHTESNLVTSNHVISENSLCETQAAGLHVRKQKIFKTILTKETNIL